MMVRSLRQVNDRIKSVIVTHDLQLAERELPRARVGSAVYSDPISWYIVSGLQLKLICLFFHALIAQENLPV
jgi:hypothetical protein